MSDIVLIDSSVSLLTETDLFKMIEASGRTCYKSEDKITSDSAEKFVRMLCQRGHTAATEAGTIYLECPQGLATTPWYDIIYSKFSHAEFDDNMAYITTNFRVIFEALNNSYEDTVTFIRDNAIASTKNHMKRYTFRIICDRGVTHELVRHRVFSFAQESTRYVNYGNKGFQFIKPAWWNEKIGENGQLTLEHSLFMASCTRAADDYVELLKFGQTPQQARAVLPNALKTEIVMTGTLYQWQQFLKLRTAPSAHPDMQIVAKQIQQLLVNEL